MAKRRKPQVDTHRYYVHWIDPTCIQATIENRGATNDFAYACRRARELAKANPLPMVFRVVEVSKCPGSSACIMVRTAR